MAEDLLLSCFCCDGLGEELADLTRVEVVDEAPDTGLAESGHALHEVDPFANGGVRIVVEALLGSSLAQHVGQESGVACLLIRHEFDQTSSFWAETGFSELLVREFGKTVMEEIKLNPFLIETQGDRLEIKVAVDHVPWQAAVCAQATCRSIGRGHRIQRYTLAVVVRCGWIWWSRRYRLCKRGWRLYSSCGRRCARVWSMIRGAAISILPDNDRIC